MIRPGEEQDYEQITSLYQSFFTTHTIFQREQDIVLAYIRKESLERDLLVYEEEEGLIKGAVFIMNLGTNEDGSHKRWKLRHFAFESENVAKQLLQEVEKRFQSQSRTAKILLYIAESEEGLEFYQKQGYSKEGNLANYYRWGERCYVLGKSLSL